MGRYLYTIRSRETGEVLFVGGEGAAARFLGCDPCYMSAVVRHSESTEKRTFYSRWKVTREWSACSIKCRMCGVTVEDASKKQKYCPQCAKKRKRIHNGEEITLQCIQEDGTTVTVQEKQRRMQKACRGCIYFGGENYLNATCNYIFIVEHSRGCPPGDGCTVRKAKR